MKSVELSSSGDMERVRRDSRVRARFGDSETVAAYVEAYGYEFGANQAIGFEDASGQLEGGVVYHDWDPVRETIGMSAAGRRRWVNYDRLRLIFDYPFEQIGCRMVWGRTIVPAIGTMCLKVGGEGYTIPGLWTVVTLTADQWRKFRDERF